MSNMMRSDILSCGKLMFEFIQKETDESLFKDKEEYNFFLKNFNFLETNFQMHLYFEQKKYYEKTNNHIPTLLFSIRHKEFYDAFYYLNIYKNEEMLRVFDKMMDKFEIDINNFYSSSGRDFLMSLVYNRSINDEKDLWKIKKYVNFFGKKLNKIIEQKDFSGENLFDYLLIYSSNFESNDLICSYLDIYIDKIKDIKNPEFFELIKKFLNNKNESHFNNELGLCYLNDKLSDILLKNKLENELFEEIDNSKNKKNKRKI